METVRGFWVGGSATDLDRPGLVAHEVGHTLHHGHSFVDPGGEYGEYDNSADLMSAGDDTGCEGYEEGETVSPCAPIHTLAINRYASGWVDADQVFFAQRTTGPVDVDSPENPGIQMIVVPGRDGLTYATIEARPAAGYDTPISFPGVAIHRIDMDPTACPTTFFDWCAGLERRQGPFFGTEERVGDMKTSS